MTSNGSTIPELLENPAAREALFRDAEDVLADRVAQSRGLTGMAIRTGFSAFQRVQPGIVGLAVARLAPHFAPILETHWAVARETDNRVAYFTMHAPTIANDLLSVTDGMADRAKNAVLVSIYRSLRGRAEAEVASAMPDVAGLLERHLG
ncbi:MAG: hypothetical protein AAGA48_05605 [Myxococcota bacterium]